MSWNRRVASERGSEAAAGIVFVYDLIASFVASGTVTDADMFVNRGLRRAEGDCLPPGLFHRTKDLASLIELVATTEWRTFDPLAWRRSTGGDDFGDLADIDVGY